MARVVASGVAAPMVYGVDWERFAPSFMSLRQTPILNEIPGVRQAMQSAKPEQQDSMVDRLALMSAPERVSTVVKLVRETAAIVLGHKAEAVEPDKAFKDLGFDSLNAVEFANRIAAPTGLKVKPALVFDYPTPTALANYLLDQLFDSQDPVQAELDRLEAMLAVTGPNDGVAERLRSLLAKLTAPTTAGEELLDKSDDEIFEFIGKEFGIS
jgi:acyl carrier protein